MRRNAQMDQSLPVSVCVWWFVFFFNRYQYTSIVPVLHDAHAEALVFFSLHVTGFTCVPCWEVAVLQCVSSAARVRCYSCRYGKKNIS